MIFFCMRAQTAFFFSLHYWNLFQVESYERIFQKIYIEIWLALITSFINCVFVSMRHQNILHEFSFSYLSKICQCSNKLIWYKLAVFDFFVVVVDKYTIKTATKMYNKTLHWLFNKAKILNAEILVWWIRVSNVIS